MARRSGQARWWVASGIGAMVTMQCHVLGVVIVVPLAWAWGADLVRRRRAGQPTAGLVRGGLGAMAVIAAGFLPLLVHELGADFAETRAILGYVAGGGREAATGVLDRIVTVGLRSITWPVTGLITDRLVVSLIGALIVTALGVIAVVGRRRGDRPAVTGTTAMATALPRRSTSRPFAGSPARWVLDRGARGVRTQPRDHRPGAAERPLPRLPGPDRADAGGRGARPPRGWGERRSSAVKRRCGCDRGAASAREPRARSPDAWPPWR